MTYVKVKGFQIFQDRHKTWRCYHRKSGTPIDLKKCPLGSLEFFAECDRIKSLGAATDQAKAGTLGLLISKYRAHRAFMELAERTRADYQWCFDYLHPIRDTALIKFSPPLVVKIRDKAAEKHGVRRGNYIKAVLSLLFAWGVERGHMKNNPAFRIKNVKKPKGSAEANRPWSDLEREVVMKALPIHMKLPVALMMCCGLDPQDAVKLPKTAIKDGSIDVRRGKTGVPLWLKLPKLAIDAAKAQPEHDALTLCANSFGKPWTVSGFRASWRPVKTKLEEEKKIQPGLTLKGLRHTVATILAEMGMDERTIADYLGQKTIEMARHYSRRADKSRKIKGVVKSFNAEVNRRRTKAVKPVLK